MRAFVIRTIWSLYRERGITRGWKPRAPESSELDKKAAAKAARGEGAPARPENLPAPAGELRRFMRRVLFEIPPAKLDKKAGGKGPTLKPMPARKAKLALVEVIRDLAVEDEAFASVVYPLQSEYMGSRGKSERAACLVATVRIQKAHTSLVGVEA